MKIEIIDLRLVDRGNSVKGFADIRLDTPEGSVKIKDFLISQPNGKVIVETPHSTYQKNGQVLFNSIVTFSEGLKTRIDVAILDRYFREREKIDATIRQ